MTHLTRLKNRLRKSKAIFIAAALLVLAAQQINAQAPGYMGQRIMVGGYLGAFPTFWDGHYNGNMKQGFTSFYLVKRIEVDYVVSRRVVMGLHYDFLNVGYPTDFYLTNDTSPMIPKENEDPNAQLIRSRALGLQIKLFKTESKGALAPMGAYFAWNFSMVNFDVWNYKKDDYKAITREVYKSDGPKFKVGVEWGNQKVLFNRVILRSGFQMGLLTGFGADKPDSEYLNELRIAYAASINLGLSLIVPYRQKVD